MKKQAKNLALLALLVVGRLNQWLPKLNIIIFFTNNNESNDNNRALLKYLVSKGFDKRYKIYFFSKDGRKYQHFDVVNYKNTWFAPLYFLFAKYCFYDCGTLKIKPAKAQKVISLWHGVPLKKIGLMLAEQSSELDRYDDFTQILVPHESWRAIYKQCFDCSDEQILINGFPRNDYLFVPKKKTLEQLGLPTNANKMVLWMPTFRQSIGGRYSDLGSDSLADWDLPLLLNKLALSSFNQKLAEQNIYLVIKLHPYSILNISELENHSHIFFVKNSDLNKHGIINYEFVACFDGLVTDYSSILFDYLLTDKPIGFTVDDMEVYGDSRGFTVANPEHYLVGDKIRTDQELLQFLIKVSRGEDDFTEQRNIVKQEVHHNADDLASQRLLQSIGLL